MNLLCKGYHTVEKVPEFSLLEFDVGVSSIDDFVLQCHRAIWKRKDCESRRSEKTYPFEANFSWPKQMSIVFDHLFVIDFTFRPFIEILFTGCQSHSHELFLFFDKYVGIWQTWVKGKLIGLI